VTEKTGYKVRIEGDGFLLERNVSKDIGEQIVVSILTEKFDDPGPDDGVQPEQSEGGIGSKQDEDKKSAKRQTPAISIRELLDKSNAKRTPDKIAAIGYYFETHDNRLVFSKDDIVKAFESAAESVPKNIARDIKWAVRAAWIAPKIDQKGLYYVTHGGKQAVDRKFPKEILKKTRHAQSSSGRIQKKRARKSK